MQNISDIHKKISFNREIFRSEIRSAKNEDLFLSKRLKYQSSDTENQHSDDQLIKNLIQTSDSNEIAQYLEELRCRSSHLEENSYFLNNPLLPNLIPILLNFLKSPELQYVCCWILINLMIGKTPLIKFCISLGLLKELLQIVEKNDVAMREQAIWGIANMAGDSDEVLDVILKENTLEKIKVMVKNLPLTIEISKNVVWLLINILRDTVYKGNFIIFFEIVEIIMENNCYEEDFFESLMLVLDKIVKKNPNVSVFEQRIDEIEGLFVKIIFYLNQEYEKMKDNVISYFLNFFGIFLLSSDETIEHIVKLNIGLCYQKTILHDSNKIRQASFWALGNIFCTNSSIINHFFKYNSLIFPHLLETIQNDSHFKVKKEAIICLSNMISVSSYAHISDLLELKALEAIFSILDIYDPDLLGLLLEMVEELLKFGELVGEKDGFLENKGNEVIMEIEKLGGVKKIENLLEHNNQKINEKAKYLLSFFETFEEI